MIILRFILFALLLSLVISTVLYLFTGKLQYLKFVRNFVKIFFIFTGILLVFTILERIGI